MYVDTSSHQEMEHESSVFKCGLCMVTSLLGAQCGKAGKEVTLYMEKPDQHPLSQVTKGTIKNVRSIATAPDKMRLEALVPQSLSLKTINPVWSSE